MSINEDYKKVTKRSNSVIRESLRIALIELLKTTEWEDISITNLCKRAGVSRLGFYRNYQNKSEIIDDIIEGILWDYMQATKENKKEPFQMEEFYHELFTFISEHMDIFRIILNEKFGQHCLNILNGHLLSLKDKDPIDWGHIVIWSGALYNLVYYWTNSPNPSRIDVMVKMCIDYLPPAPFD